MSFASELVKYPPILEAVETDLAQQDLDFVRLVVRGALRVPYPDREHVLARAQTVFGIEPDVLDFAKSNLVLKGVIRLQDTRVVHGEAFLSPEPYEVESMGMQLRNLRPQSTPEI